MSEQIEPSLKKRPSISDVALEAGVSKAAVSKVIRNAYGVSPAMRERVETAINRLEYRPLHAARVMRGASFTIGFEVPHLGNDFFTQITEGAASKLAGSGYQLIIAPGLGYLSGTKVLDTLVDRQVDGIIAISSDVEADWWKDSPNRSRWSCSAATIARSSTTRSVMTTKPGRKWSWITCSRSGTGGLRTSPTDRRRARHHRRPGCRPTATDGNTQVMNHAWSIPRHPSTTPTTPPSPCSERRPATNRDLRRQRHPRDRSAPSNRRARPDRPRHVGGWLRRHRPGAAPPNLTDNRRPIRG